MTDKEYLFKELKDLQGACEALKYSFEKCKKIDIKIEYTDEELSDIEAFTSRFVRISDIIIQKTLKILEKFDLEETLTVRDRIYLAEKKELIDSAEELIKIRELRNRIAHEYILSAAKHILEDTLKYTLVIFKCVNNIENYITKKYL